MEKLLKSKDIAANKLIILYAMRKLDTPVSNIQLTAYMLEQHLMDFFSFQQHVNEMAGAGYLDAVPDAGASSGAGASAGAGGGRRLLYRLSESGAALLGGMEGLLPRAEKNRIDRTVSAIRGKAKDELAVSADYTPIDENRQGVCLKFSEGDLDMLKIELQTASKAAARQICANWKARALDVYAKLVDELLRE
jgi:hypothetical protein